MSYKVETHVHTAESSACATLKAADQVKQYMKAGYSGMIITDHFVNGNSAVNRKLDWDSQMSDQFLGYRNALKAAEGTDFKVYFGVEYAFHGTEFIVIGLTEQWFKDHPEIIYTLPEDFLDIFRKAGAAIIQAHPYREASYIREIRLFPELVDAIEGFNLHNKNMEWNVKAQELAKAYNKPVTAGSDCHHLDELGAGIDLEVLPSSDFELAAIIKSGKGWEFFGNDANL